MSWRSFSEIKEREEKLRREIYNKLLEIILYKKYAFRGVTFKNVVWDWEVDGRKADIVVFDGNDNPFLIIETKREAKGHTTRGVFNVTERSIVGQVISYAALAKSKGLSPRFAATCNPMQIAIFRVPDDIDKLINWKAVGGKDYEAVLPLNLYHELVYGKYRVDTRRLELSERFFIVLLEDLVDLASGVRAVEDIAPITFKVIQDLRSFVEWLAYDIVHLVEEKSRTELKSELERIAEEKGYRPTPGQLAREMAYVFMNKLIFYKVLERHWKELPKLEPLLPRGIKKSEEYVSELERCFTEAIKVTKNFEPIFITGIYDKIPIPDDPEVLKGIDEFIDYLEGLGIDKLSDIIGYIYEELIPAEERHQLGQFYTPPPVAELIVKWCIRKPNDKVLDPGCGSGTFLIEAYKRLHYLKTGQRLEDVKYSKGEIHESILEQLYAIDINEFPAHITAMNQAMKNPKAPSTKMNILVEDFFSIKPCRKVLLPYKTIALGQKSEEEEKVMIHVPKVDCVVGNPPYTRWTEIPESIKENITNSLEESIKKYGLTPQVTRGSEPGIYVYWIMHATEFLENGSRLGMIISDSWLQAVYGINFFKYLLDNYKVHAIIDISTRVFPIPLIGTCIILMERCTDQKEREDNKFVFMYLHIPQNRRLEVDEVLKLIEEAKKSSQNYIEFRSPSGATALAKIYRQGDLLNYNERLINLLFNTGEIINRLKQHKLIVPLSKYFEPSYGNIKYIYLASRDDVRGVRNVGGEEFFYLTERKARDYGIPGEYLHPLLPSSSYMKFFIFKESDWKAIKDDGGECYLFLAHEQRGKLPSSVREYIECGEGAKTCRKGIITLKKGSNKDKPVSESAASSARKHYKNYFYDWYDLGGVIDAPIYVTRGVQYWVRFVLAEYRCALDDRIVALIPKNEVKFDEVELKALLAFLNSSFSQLQAEIKGRSTGGGMIELDVKPLSEFLILDVKRLPREVVERLAELFEKLESEVRRLDGADRAENILGSRLAGELTGREAIHEVEGLFDTVIKDTDYEIAKVLNFEDLVELLRSLILELVKRRLSRAGKARPEVLRGSEEPPVLRREKKEKLKKPRTTATLDKFITKGGRSKGLKGASS